MSLYSEKPLANGIRTDHPAPNLPFVDDSHIPIDDPDAVEDIGRGAGGEMWGRCDIASNGEWIAVTTDPQDTRYCWAVRYHPDHGRSVLLYRNGDLANVQSGWIHDRPLLVRWGGYWWDGTNWYRPPQVLSWATEQYVRRTVPQAATVTAGSILDSTCQAAQGELIKVNEFQPHAVDAGQWRHDLALWAQLRHEAIEAAEAAYEAAKAKGEKGEEPKFLADDRCVVTLAAPELAVDQLLTAEQFAGVAGIAVSTLRAYLARGEGNVPTPQTTIAERSLWSRAVAADWAEQRQRDPKEIGKLLKDNNDEFGAMSRGQQDLAGRIGEVFFNRLWSAPEERRRWSSPYRNEGSARALADNMAIWAATMAAESLPHYEIETAISQSVLWELTRFYNPALHKERFIDLPPATGRLLGWFTRQFPDQVQRMFGAIVRQANDLESRACEDHPQSIPKAVIEKSLKISLFKDGNLGLNETEFEDLFTRLVSPPTN
jgi:hypothetical protein